MFNANQKNNSDKKALYYTNNYNELSNAIDKILVNQEFDFDEFIFKTYSKENINKKSSRTYKINMKILIIGGAGFLGFHLVTYLEKIGHKVKVFDKSKGHFKNSKKKIILGDINDYKKLRSVIRNQDVVYNLAAISDIGDLITNPIGTTKSNILANVFILDLCVKFKIKKFIFASTIYVHSNQGSFYRVSKQSSELFVEEYNKRYGLNYSIIRFGSVFGPKASKKNGLTRIINTAIKKNKIYYNGTKRAIRRFIYVKDAARGSAEVLKKNIIIRIYY